MGKNNILSMLAIIICAVVILPTLGMSFVISDKLSMMSNSLLEISSKLPELKSGTLKESKLEAIKKDWDMSIIFNEAHQNPIYPFSKTPGEIGKIYYEKLNATDSLYEEYVGQETCTKGDNVYMWDDFPSIYEKEQARRAKGWYAERKEITSSKYKILIRGQAWADCDYGESGYVKGELNFNVDKNWEITEVVKCSAQDSNKGQTTYCETGKDYVRFAAGNSCGGCCACADSGGLDIEIIVDKK